MGDGGEIMEVGRNALRMCDEGAKRYTAFTERARGKEKPNKNHKKWNVEEREKVCGGLSVKNYTMLNWRWRTLFALQEGERLQRALLTLFSPPSRVQWWPSAPLGAHVERWPRVVEACRDMRHSEGGFSQRWPPTWCTCLSQHSTHNLDNVLVSQLPTEWTFYYWIKGMRPLLLFKLVQYMYI